MGSTDGMSQSTSCPVKSSSRSIRSSEVPKRVSVKGGDLRRDGDDCLIAAAPAFSSSASTFSWVQKEPHIANPTRSFLTQGHLVLLKCSTTASRMAAAAAAGTIRPGRERAHTWGSPSSSAAVQVDALDGGQLHTQAALRQFAPGASGPGRSAGTVLNTAPKSVTDAPPEVVRSPAPASRRRGSKPGPPVFWR